MAVREKRGFLSLTGYYHKIVAGYGKIATPLTSLLKKDAFEWIEAMTRAFEELKTVMWTAPVLALLDFTKQFVIKCEAFRKGIEASLMQPERPITYLSKTLLGKSQQLSTYECEMLTIMHTMTK
ncbi:uncharacterized mitochondrial protein AtMg00860-like [Typha latifolia]|uniref:uncharacterized mitochondrial protein AtMg00860-like n=1 Tax=Typha latifolia TaxID=4733 RepID=UPI003C2AF253